MAKWTEAKIAELLSSVKMPGMERDIVEYGVLRGLEIDGDRVTVTLEVLARSEDLPRELQQRVETTLQEAGLQPEIEM